MFIPIVPKEDYSFKASRWAVTEGGLKMILNDTLQKHEDCLEQCELERVACELDQEQDKTCDIELKTCKRDCEFDYGP